MNERTLADRSAIEARPDELGDLPAGYVDLLHDIKSEISSARMRTARAVNTELVNLYWRIGKLIVERQERDGWGSKVIARIAVDLATAYPGQRGFGRASLHYMRKMALAWPSSIVQQPIGQLPWGHVVTLLDDVKEQSDRDFYARIAVDSGWSRNVLITQIKMRLHERAGTAPNTFAHTIPEQERRDLGELLNDPYVLDFARLDPGATERDLEDALVGAMTHFLPQLGCGFAFMGRQYPLSVGGDEFRMDLLFYHVKLHRYVVFELKVGKFQPEYVGKLNFYVNVVDGLMRDRLVDSGTIGILLVASRNNVVVEYALNGVTTPIGVSGFTFDALPDDVQAQLPSAETLRSAVAETIHDLDWQAQPIENVVPGTA